MKTAVIIGAGPAGLTAAYELLTKTDIKPIIVEADRQVGGLSKTIDYKGNKIDIGGHRFFSKSDRVINWWLQFLPLESGFGESTLQLHYQNKKKEYRQPVTNSINTDKVMLVRKRKSRIYYQNKFFDYPLQLNRQTIRNLGLVKMFRIGLSYITAKIFPQKKEENLEQFFQNRFGKELYETFFKDYTEKVWGVPCNMLPASWGYQRVKDLNISKVITHAIRSIFITNKTISQKNTSTSLIEQFLYPKYGPGQMWETVAEEIIKRGGTILLNTSVATFYGDGNNRIESIETVNNNTREKVNISADYFFSTMPVKQLVENTKNLSIPDEVKNTASALEYRDFLIVGLLATGLSIKEKNESSITDNWIYIQDKNIKAGRLQFFHNWSPSMVRQPGDVWMGVEYFCNETDPLWQSADQQLTDLVIKEMESICILSASDVKDSIVVRVKNAYPSYYGGYNNFDCIQTYFNSIENLFLVGRNGMHRYNNSDHSMLTAMAAVENIIAGTKDKTNIWNINAEEEYIEEDSLPS